MKTNGDVNLKGIVDKRIPRYGDLIMPTFVALKELGGSSKNSEILEQIIKDLKIPDEIADIQHKGRVRKSELSYQADWARTYLKICGVLENSSRGVWAILPDYVSVEKLNTQEIIATVVRKTKKASIPSEQDDKPENDDSTDDYTEFPDESKP